jgi:hypothetical protein
MKVVVIIAVLLGLLCMGTTAQAGCCLDSIVSVGPGWVSTGCSTCVAYIPDGCDAYRYNYKPCPGSQGEILVFQYNNGPNCPALTWICAIGCRCASETHQGTTMDVCYKQCDL